MLLATYAPKTTGEFIGNSSGVREIKKFIGSWRKGQCLLIHGPSGTGKTTAVRLIAKENDFELVEIHPGEKMAFEAANQRSIFSKKKIIFIEDVEATSMRGFSDLIKKSSFPVVCTTEDAYRISSSVRRSMKLVKFEKVSDQELVALGKNIAELEKFNTDTKQLEQLARQSNGDLRSFLIDLETLFIGIAARQVGFRNFEENIFNTIKVIFKTMNIENAKIAVENSGKDPEEIFFWLENNIKEEYTDIETIARAYEFLSRADLFQSRIIRRQSWSLLKYVSDLSVFGTALAKEKPSARFVNYQIPFYMRRSSSSALKKIGTNFHSSARTATQYIPLLRTHPKLCEEIGLDDKETDFVLGY